MQSFIKEEKGLKRKLELVFSAEEVKDCFLKNYQKIQKKAKMSGFRAGKIPLATVQRHYKGQAHEAVTNDLFRFFYPQALKENNLRPAGPPRLIDLSLQEEKTSKLLLDLEIHPQVKVENYLHLKLKKQPAHVTEKDVEEALEKLRQSLAQFEDSLNKGPLKKGDFASFNIEGFLEDKKLINYSQLLLAVGQNSLAPGFDDQLIDLKLNEEKEFYFAFPKDHPHSKIAGQNLRLKVKLLSFKDKKIPELNDDLAKQFKLETLGQLKDKIKKDLKNNLEQKSKEKLENDIAKKLVEQNPVDLPETLIKEQKQKLKDNAQKQLEKYKMPLAEQEVFLKEKDPVFEKEAKESLHLSYLMNQLIQDLKIKATREDIKASLQQSFPEKAPEEMEQKLKTGKYWDQFVFNLTRQKTLSYLIEKADITNEPA